jgi:hypothetical protein
MTRSRSDNLRGLFPAGGFPPFVARQRPLSAAGSVFRSLEPFLQNGNEVDNAGRQALPRRRRSGFVGALDLLDELFQSVMVIIVVRLGLAPFSHASKQLLRHLHFGFADGFFGGLVEFRNVNSSLGKCINSRMSPSFCGLPAASCCPVRITTLAIGIMPFTGLWSRERSRRNFDSPRRVAEKQRHGDGHETEGDGVFPKCSHVVEFAQMARFGRLK